MSSKDMMIVKEVEKFRKFYFDSDLEVSYMNNIKRRFTTFYIHYTPSPSLPLITYEYQLVLSFDDIYHINNIIEVKELYNKHIKEYRS